ncbi:T9SS type A sorting domain-containing protein [Lunatimonas salinarum]|uniref:T9SS type A sorting domain-containing protein n=1 Tax=Lunatimonas salinarum TaxID=1774590 RepID=UPI001AE01037|nr:T9SS type A sorting domain-containing protein [Lunatimonas salinarum]
MMKQKRWSIGGIVGLLLFFSGINEVMGQLDCEPTAPFPTDYFTRSDRYRGNNLWQAVVFQLAPEYNPANDHPNNRNFVYWDGSGWNDSRRDFKGWMLRNNSGLYLPISGLPFNSQFEDTSPLGEDAGLFFPTGTTAGVNSSGGCNVEKQHFGVLARSRFIVPPGGEGIYLVSVGSDDGSFFRMFVPGSYNSVLTDINGRPIQHDNWFKDGSDGVFNYVYEDNIRNYYVYLSEGQEVWMNLNYYEKTGRSRLGFDFRLYVGPGEINIGEPTSLKSERYCGINPQPQAFEQFSPAVFADGTIPNYEWEYSLVNDPDPENWTVITGATDATYQVPAYNDLTTEEYKDDMIGTLYFRRVAIDANGDRFPSNVLEITEVEPIADLDQEEYGNNMWIGHIYREIGNFDSDHYLGRIYEPEVNFEQDFGGSPSLNAEFFPDYGCSFYTTRFSVRYKMRYTAQPGVYTAQIRGDDGFRLSFDGGNTWVINSFVDGARTITAPPLEVEEEKVLEIVIEYFENTNNQVLDFSFASIILPVEWGQVSGEACGAQNCLTWETIQEKNSSHFVVERSYDGREWNATGESIAGQGNTTQRTFYTFTDGSFLAERTFYRIRQVDLDGSVDYSEIVRIDNANFARKMAPYPNPTTDRLRFYSPEPVKMVRISSHDAKVQLPLFFESLGQNIYEVDISMLQNNQYVVTVVGEQNSHHHKVIKR